MSNETTKLKQTENVENVIQIEESGIELHSLTMEEYLAHPAWGSSSFTTALTKSMFHVKHRRSGGSTKATLFGTAVHNAIEAHFTGVEFKQIVKPQNMGFNIKEGKAWKKVVLSEGYTIVENPDKANFRIMVENAIRALETVLSGDMQIYFEKTIFGKFQGLDTKIRPDISVFSEGFCRYIIDTKTSAEPTPKKFKYSISDFGYDNQGVFYVLPVSSPDCILPFEGFKGEVGLEGEPEFLNFVIESKYPHFPVFYKYSDKAKTFALHNLYIAAAKIKICIESDIWPGYDLLNIVDRTDNGYLDIRVDDTF